MYPLLQPNDLLYLKKEKFTNIKISDSVLVKKNRHIFVHSVIYKTKKYLITRGINNLLSDGLIYPKQIIGKVYQMKRKDRLFDPYKSFIFQSGVYFQEIVRIKDAFEYEKINFLILKGLPLHLYFEGSYPRRIYADCDLLINKNDWEKTSKILEESGYRKAETSYSRIHKLLKDKPTEWAYFKNINDFPVIFDIHLEAGFLMNQLGKLNAFYPQSLIDKMTEKFLKGKKLVKMQSQYFSILSPANLIIYLSLHYFHHNYRGWHMIDFLSKIVKRYQNNNDILKEITEKIIFYQLQNFVYPVFLFLEKYYDINFQKNFLESIKPDKTRLNYIKKKLLTVNIFDGEPRIKAGINRFKNLFFLSPYPLWKRLLIIFNIQVIYSVFWVITLLVRRSLIKAFKSS